jgi:o-succinylbenzoate synthase
MAKPHGSISFKPYRLKLQTPYRWSKGEQLHRAGLIVRTDFDGAVGWGEVALPPHVEQPDQGLLDQVKGLTAELDPSSEDFLDELELRECPPRIRCGLSTAILSARAVKNGESLAQHVAGSSQTIPSAVPVNELIGDADPNVCVERARVSSARGQDTVKVKVTTERGLDLKRVGAIRQAFPQLKMRIDPNESWPLDWAAEQLRAMAQFNIEYVEEPLPRGTPMQAYVALRKQQPIPIALDDSARSLVHVERIVELGAADFLILKAQRVGGPDRLFDIVRYAEKNGVPCTVTSSLETSVGLYLGVHCAAVTAAPIKPAGIGTARFFAENVGEPPPIIDGHMNVPKKPGLGFAPDAWWHRKMA